MGHCSPRHWSDMHRYSLFLLTPVWVKGISFSHRVLRKHLRQHKQAKRARVWVEVRDKAHRPRLRGPRGFYAVVPQAEHVDQSDIQGTFLLLHLLPRVLFKFGCTIFITVASCVIDLNLEVETSRKAIVWEFSPRN